MKVFGPIPAQWGILCVVCLSLPVAVAAQDTPSAEAVAQYRVAEQYQKLGEFDLAAQEWAQLAKAHPNDPLAAAAVHYAGVCHYQLGNYAEAASRFASFEDKYPQHELAEASLTNLGLAYYNLAAQQSGDQSDATYQQAIATFDRLRQQFPAGKFTPQGDYYRAESLYALGQKQAAREAYQKWLADHGDHQLAGDVRLALGVTQTELGDAKAAIATLEEFLNSDPQGNLAAEASLRLGDALMAADRPDQAAQRYAAAGEAENFADADYALQQQGAALFTAGEYEQAAKVYASLPERFPQSPRIAASRAAAGKSYYQLGDYQQAARMLAEATKGAPDDIESAHWLARALLKQGDAAGALAAIESHPAGAADARLLLDRADALYELPERRAESIAAYVAAAEQGEGELAAEALHLAAATALELGESRQAESLAARLIDEHRASSYANDARQTLAEAKIQLGENAEAVKLYQQLLTSIEAEQRLNWTVRLAWAQSGNNDQPGVIATLSPVVDKLEAPLKQEAHYLLGRALAAEGQHAKAAGHLSKAAESNETWSADAALQLARAQQQAGEGEAALATLEQLLSRQPAEGVATQATFRRGEVRQQLGDAAGAGSDYQLVAQRWPQHALAPYALYRAATIALDVGEAPRAVELLERLLDTYPDHKLATDARLALGTSLAQAKQYPQAIDVLSQVVAVGGDYAARDRALYELAWAYRDQEQGAEATNTFEQLTREYPESPFAAEGHYRVGETLYDREKWKEAVARFRAATTSPQAEPVLREKGLHMIAWSELKQGEAKQAAASFAKQLEEFPEGSLAGDARWMRGEALYQAEEYEQALAAYQEARDATPSAPNLAPLGHLHAGQSAAQIEQWQTSADWLAAGREKFPEYAGKNHLEFEWATAMWKLGNDEEAARVFEEVADRDPSPLGARARFMLGELQFAAKNYEEAVRSFFKVSNGYQYPNSPEGYHPWQAESMFEAARCLEQLQRSAAAQKLYTELVERFPNEPKAQLAERRLEELSRQPR